MFGLILPDLEGSGAVEGGLACGVLQPKLRPHRQQVLHPLQGIGRGSLMEGRGQTVYTLGGGEGK